MVLLMVRYLAGGSQMKINDTRRALKDMLAVKVIRLGIKSRTMVAEFGEGNPYHDEKGRFDSGPGGGGKEQGDVESPSKAPGWLSADQKKVHDSLPESRKGDYIQQIQQENRSKDKGAGRQAGKPRQSAPSAPSGNNPSRPSGNGNREGVDYSVKTRKADGSPESVRYTGRDLRPLEAGYVPKLSDKEITDINTKENRGYDGKSRPAEYQGEAVHVDGKGWVPPYPHDFYKLNIAGVADILTKKDASGKTALDDLIRNHDTIDFRGGKPGSGKNDLYIYDGKAIGIPFKIAVAIDTSSGKVATIAPRNATLKEARDLVISGGHNPGNEIVNIKTSAGRERMAKLNGLGGKK